MSATLSAYCALFGKALTERRQKARMTMLDLAVKAGIPPEIVVRCESGEYSPSYLIRRKMSVALGLGEEGLENEAIGYS